MNGLHEELDRALRGVTVGEAPVERARRDGRRLRTGRRVAVAAGALAVAAVAAVTPALARSTAAAPSVPAAGPTTRNTLPNGDPVVTDGLPAGTTEAAGGLTSKTGVIARGQVGGTSWSVTFDTNNTATTAPCYTATVGSQIMLPDCRGEVPQLSGGDPGDFNGASIGSTATTVGVAAANVTYFVLTFTDGQQLKLIPVTAGGHRYVAWAAPESMTIVSLVAHLGGPYTDSGQTESAVPFQLADHLPAFGLWLRPGEAAPPSDTENIAAGASAGHPWNDTAYEGPWGTCFVAAADTTQSANTTECVPSKQLTTTAVLGGWGGDTADPAFGSAAPGVTTVRVALSNGQTVAVNPAEVGNENLFAFWIGPGVSPTSWTAYSASGHKVGSGSVHR
jgi:hypothetical protein